MINWNNTYKYIFFLGRPGCGKSEIFSLISKGIQKQSGQRIKFSRLDDFLILQQMLDKDTDCKRHVKNEGGFEVTDFTILDEVLVDLDKEAISKNGENKLTFIEFSRNDYTHALELFSRDLLQQTLIIYIHCHFEICLERNHLRFKTKREMNPDDHIVPESIMYSYYRVDDYEKTIENQGLNHLIKYAPTDLIVINNNNDLASLQSQVDNIVTIFNRSSGSF